MEESLHPVSSLGSSILSYLQEPPSAPEFYKVKFGKSIKKYTLYKKLGISDQAKIDQNSYGSDDSDMAVEDGPAQANTVEEILAKGVKLTFDKEVIEILTERKNIKVMETNKPNPEDDESLDNMYSDIDEEEPLDTGADIDLGNKEITELAPNTSQKIEDLVNAITQKRELERQEKKKNDIPQANWEDYFMGFSSTITKKVENPKKIRSVMEEALKKDDYLTEQQQLAELTKKIKANMNSDNYMEWFPEAQEEIRGFDETNFAAKVKEKFYDEEVIQKDQDWHQAERSFHDGATGQKFNEKNLKRREAKAKVKLHEDTKRLNKFMENN